MFVAVEEHGELSKAHSREARWAHAEEFEIDAIGWLEREFVAQELVFALPYGGFCIRIFDVVEKTSLPK